MVALKLAVVLADARELKTFFDKAVPSRYCSVGIFKLSREVRLRMKFDHKSAKALSSTKELALFDSSRSPKLNRYTVAELKQLVQSSRALKDKLTNVKRSQIRTGQAATSQRGVSAANRSREKAELYSDVHDRFVKRLEELEASAATKATPAAAPGRPTKTAKRIESKADRTLVRQKLKSVKSDVNATKPAPAGKAKTVKATPKIPVAGTKGAKKTLASMATSSAGKGEPVTIRSAKATTASKAAVNPEVDALQSKRSAARVPTSQGEVLKTRFAKSGAPRQTAHQSSANKRGQSKRDSK